MKITEQRLRKIIKTLLNEADVSDIDINDIKKKITIKDINTVKMLLIELDNNKKDLKAYTASNEDTRNLRQRIRQDKKELYKLVNKHIKAISSVVGGDKKAKSIYWRNSWLRRSASKIQANIIKKISNASGSRAKDIQKAANQAAAAAASGLDNQAQTSDATPSGQEGQVRKTQIIASRDFVEKYKELLDEFNRIAKKLSVMTTPDMLKRLGPFISKMKKNWALKNDIQPFELDSIKKHIVNANASVTYAPLLTVMSKAVELKYVDNSGNKIETMSDADFVKSLKNKKKVREDSRLSNIYNEFISINSKVCNKAHNPEITQYTKRTDRESIAFWSEPKNYSNDKDIESGYKAFLEILSDHKITKNKYTLDTIEDITVNDVDRVKKLHDKMKKKYSLGQVRDTLHIDEMMHGILAKHNIQF